MRACLRQVLRFHLGGCQVSLEDGEVLARGQHAHGGVDLRAVADEQLGQGGVVAAAGRVQRGHAADRSSLNVRARLENYVILSWFRRPVMSSGTTIEVWFLLIQYYIQ